MSLLPSQVKLKTYDQRMLHMQVTFFCAAVIGCGDYSGKPPDGAHVKPEPGGRVTVYCNETGESFELVCDGRQWRGDRRNCSSPATPVSIAKTRKIAT
jgi:hypothetical protein